MLLIGKNLCIIYRVSQIIRIYRLKMGTAGIAFSKWVRRIVTNLRLFFFYLEIKFRKRNFLKYACV